MNVPRQSFGQIAMERLAQLIDRGSETCKFKIEFSYSLTPFEEVQQAVAVLSNAIRNTLHKVEDHIAELRTQKDQKSSALANLRKNIKDYPRGLLQFKERLANELEKQTAYIASEKQSGELVIYHGGFLSPQKRRLFALIANGAAATTNMQYWADIDMGGFRMFQQLQEIIPTLAPMRMSGEFVDQYHEHGLIRSKEYLSTLKTDMENGKYWLFKDAIEKILSYGVTIEQEAFLNEQGKSP